MALAALIAYLAGVYLQPGIQIPALAALRPMVILTVVLVAAVIPCMARRRRAAILDGHMRQILIFLGFMALSVATAYIKSLAWEKWLVFGRLVLLVFFMVNVVDGLSRLRTFLYWMLGIHVFVALDGLRGFYTAGERLEAPGLEGTLSSFLGDANDFALAVLVMLPYAYYLGVETRSKKTRLLLTGCVLLFAVAAAFSFSRGGFLTLLVLVGHFLWKSKRRLQGAAAIGALALAILVVMPSSFWRRMETIYTIGSSQDDANAQARLFAWAGGLKMALGNPLLGMGPGNWVTGYRVFYRPEGAGLQNFTAHSIYFQTAGELGLGGILLAGWLVRSTFKTRRALRDDLASEAWRDHSDRDFVTAVSRATEASLLAFLVGGAFLSATYYPHFWFNLAFTQMLAVGARQAARPRAEPVSVGFVNRFHPRPGRPATETS